MFKSKEFRHKVTGELVTQVPIMQMHEYADPLYLCKCVFPAPNCERDTNGVWYCKGCGLTVKK